MLKVTLLIGRDFFDFTGDVPLAEVCPVIEEWFDALPHTTEAPVQQLAIDRLTARLAAANTKLLADVGAATPT